MLLLPSNSASMGHFNLVGDMVGGECMELFFFEIYDVFVIGDSGFEFIVGWDRHEFLGGVR